MEFSRLGNLLRPADTKILLLVIDGLGGANPDPDSLTALEAARTPHLDELARASLCGLHQPAGAGITPGSGPAHLALLGYDPFFYSVGRGVLSALGIGFDLHHHDVAARGNFCTLDSEGSVVDRRAGRMSGDKARELCRRLEKIQLSGAELFIRPVADYRFTLVLRADGLSDEVTESDPQVTGRPPRPVVAETPQAAETARLANEFLEQAREMLRDQSEGNHVLLRGFGRHPQLPEFGEVFGIKAAALAAYPMYRGIGRLLGMELLEGAETLEENAPVLRQNWPDYDFFFVHYKKTDSAGEDGDIRRKISLIENVDKQLPHFLELKPDVLVITGDHSTPAPMKSHSWHPVPVIIHSKYCRPDPVQRFGERDCIQGGLGPVFPTTELMPLVLANALRLEKFGA